MVDRRTVLSQAAAVGLVGSLAGCADTASAQSRHEAPQVNEELLDGWVQLGDPVEDTIEKTGVSAYTTTLLYRNEALEQQVSELVLGELSQPLSAFFMTKAVVSGVASGALKPIVVQRAVHPEIISQLDGFGVELSESARTLDGGLLSAQTVVYDGSVTVDAQQASIPLPDGSTEQFEIPSAALSVELRYSVWESGEDIMIAGGLYPVSNYAPQIEPISLTGVPGEGVDVTVDVALPFETYDLTRDIELLVEGVEQAN